MSEGDPLVASAADRRARSIHGVKHCVVLMRRLDNNELATDSIQKLSQGGRFGGIPVSERQYLIKLVGFCAVNEIGVSCQQ